MSNKSNEFIFLYLIIFNVFKSLYRCKNNKSRVLSQNIFGDFMFYQFDDDVTGVAFEDLRDNVLTVGFLSQEELLKYRKALALPLQAAELCREESSAYPFTTEIYDDCYFIRLEILGKESSSRGVAGLFIKKNLFIMISICESDFLNRDLFLTTVSASGLENAELENVLTAFFHRLASLDRGHLAKLRGDINRLEEKVINNKYDEAFNSRLLEIKKKILDYREYYENLIDIAQALYENKNEIFCEKISDIKLFSDKAERMKNSIDALADSVVHLWDAYQASLNMRLNEIMKIFTVVTTVFFPLTVIVGWYGMNFSLMPEFKWKYGYIYVIILSGCVIAGLVLWFKKRKWI